MNKRGRLTVPGRTMAPRSFLLTLLISSTGLADPAWKNQLGPHLPGPHTTPPAGTLTLRVSWKGMLDSGKLHIDFAPRDAKKPGRLVVRSNASSMGPAAALFPYQSHFWSEIHPSTLKPVLFNASEADKKGSTSTTTRYLADHVVSTELTSRPGKADVREEKRFKFAPVHDIFSAMLLIRSQKLAEGDNIQLVVQPFTTPYLLRVTVKGREQHNGRNTIRLSVGMRKIDRKTFDLLPYKKMKTDATLWLGDDADRMPVEFRAAVFIGDIRATITGYTPHHPSP